MAEIRVIESKKKEVEEEIFINPDTFDLLTKAREWIDIAGCSEIQIVVTSGCMSFSEVFDTQERSEAGLGAMSRYTQRYNRELDAEFWDEE